MIDPFALIASRYPTQDGIVPEHFLQENRNVLIALVIVPYLMELTQ